MFESIVIRRAESDVLQFDPGVVAEALLFYQNVHLLLDRGALETALKSIGPDSLIRLFETGHAKATFIRESLGTYSDGRGFVAQHHYAEFELHGANGRRLRSKRDFLDDCFSRALGESRETRNFARRFAELVPWRRLSDGIRETGGVCRLAMNDLNDEQFRERAIRVVLSEIIPNYEIPSDFHFRIFDDRGRFVVATNLDFDATNRCYIQRFGGTSGPFTPAFLAGFILDARADLYLAGAYGAEMLTTPASSKIIQLRLGEWATELCAEVGDGVKG